MSDAFWFVQNRITEDEVTKKELEISKIYGMGAKIYYKKNSEWLPIYVEKLCEGLYANAPKDLCNIEKILNSPVLVVSTFDEDFEFLQICVQGKMRRYVRGEYEEFYDYENMIPDELYEWGMNREQLEELWYHETAHGIWWIAKFIGLLGAELIAK